MFRLLGDVGWTSLNWNSTKAYRSNLVHVHGSIVGINLTDYRGKEVEEDGL